MRIAILAPFDSFSETYSLSHVVAHQAHALCQGGAHGVRLWVGDSCDPALSCNRLLLGRLSTMVDRLLHLREMVADVVDASRVSTYADDLRKGLSALRPHVVITHDAMFQGHYVDLAAAIHRVAPDSNALWFHYVHSAPSLAAHSDSPRRNIPDGHFIIYPNESEIERVATYYNISPSRVFGCSNPHDPTILWSAPDFVTRIVREYGLVEKDVVQVYPICSTRMEAKGVPSLVRIFEKMKTQNRSVCLVIANANANAEREKDAIQKIRTGSTLTEHELVFTSEIAGENLQAGVPHMGVQALMRYSNTFIFPTVSEVGPLILLEAMMQGCVIAANAGLVPSLKAYMPDGAIGFHLPRFVNIPSLEVKAGDLRLVGQNAYDQITTAVAFRVLRTLDECPANRARKTAFRLGSLARHRQQLESIFLKAGAAAPATVE